MENKFSANPELNLVYNRIAIFAVYGADDFCTSGEKSLIRLKQLIPGVASYLHPGRHHDHYESVFCLMQTFLSGDLDKLQLVFADNHIVKAEDQLNVPDSFTQIYLKCFQVEPSSTSVMLMDMGVEMSSGEQEYELLMDSQPTSINKDVDQREELDAESSKNIDLAYASGLHH